MKANRRTALSRAGMMLCAVLLLGSYARPAGRIEQPTVMGDFIVPVLAGWKADLYRGDPISRVDFKKTVDGKSLLLKFCYFKPISGLPPPSASRLRKDEAFRQRHFDQMSKETGGALMHKTITSRPTRFRGWPAYYLVWDDHTRGEAPTEARLLKFIYRQKEYWVSVSYPLEPRSPKALKAATDGWNQLTSRLKAQEQSGKHALQRQLTSMTK